MKKYKIYVSAILTLILIFGNITTCYCIESLEILEALGTVYSAVEASNSAESKRQAVSNWIHKNSEAAGFLFDATSSTLPSALWYLLPDSVQNELGSNASDDDIVDACRNFILNNQTVSNNTITDNSSLKNGIINFVNNYKSNYSNNIKYSIDIKNSQQYLDSTLYNALVSFCEEYQDDYIIILNGSRSVFNIWAYPRNKNTIWVHNYILNQTVWGNLYAYNNNSFIDIYAENQDIKRFAYSSGSYTESAAVETGSLGALLAPNENWSLSVWTNYSYCISYNKSFPCLFYTSLNDASSSYNGTMPYYYNNSVYNNFSRSSGDYTVDNSNVNTVSYGDVTEYVSDYHGTNNNYPDNSTVNNWIENTNEENITNNNGGGSGGDNGGDNGGGSGGDNGGGSSDSNIFDFLSDIGAVLGNLIKNLGNVLTELISGIAEIITGLFEAIPTIFGDFLGALLGWLPEEIRALIILGITAMIIVGIIKVIRG